MLRSTQHILVPKSKRKNRGAVAELEAAKQDVPLLSESPYYTRKEKMYIWYENMVAIYANNWKGMFEKCKLIIEESSDPSQDRKCWANLISLLPKEARIEVLKPENLKYITEDTLYSEQVILLQSKEPNLLQMDQLCHLAGMMLCCPAHMKSRIYQLWIIMLDVFKRVTIHEIVEEYLGNEEMQAESRKHVEFNTKTDSPLTCLEHIRDAESVPQKA
jgi:hypothetical protein